MIPALSTRRNQVRSLIFLVACVASAIAAPLVGISDNPPGIALAFFATITFILAFAHPWRRSIQFRKLFYASAAAAIILAVVHNAFEVLAHRMAAGIVATLLEFLSVTAFLIAVLLCPSGLLVGGVGAVITAIWPPRPQAGSATA
jgi:hypothetical protein